MTVGSVMEGVSEGEGDTTTVVGVVKEVIRMIADDDETARTLARAVKRIYDELIAAGFTEDQAIRLLNTPGGKSAVENKE